MVNLSSGISSTQDKRPSLSDKISGKRTKTSGKQTKIYVRPGELHQCARSGGWVDEDNLGNVRIWIVHIISLSLGAEHLFNYPWLGYCKSWPKKDMYGFFMEKRLRIDGSNLPGHWTGVLGSRTVGGGCRDCPL